MKGSENLNKENYVKQGEQVKGEKEEKRVTFREVVEKQKNRESVEE